MPILDWMTRGEDVVAAARVPYRMLEAVPGLDGGDGDPANMLIQGDNLDALKALLPYYAGRVKCIYIDPPYNTRSAFEHYDDNLEHAQWLAMIYPRLVLLRELLAEDGSIWVSIDDNEGHYLKVVMDEVFGRRNFIAEVIWRTSDSSNNNVTKFSLDHNATYVFAKRADWQPKFLQDASKRKHFKNKDNDPRGPWFDGNNMQNPGLRPNLQFDVVAPDGTIIKHPPNGWRWSRETIEYKMRTGEIRFSADNTRLIRRTYLADMPGLPPSTLWVDLEDTGHNRQAKYELKSLSPEMKVTDLFTTPKPEKLIKKILQLSTNPGDLVLDSFLGSGTTAAVAHKMGRRWIGIEMGDHAETHCKPRLDKVIAGEQGGVSAAVGWQGGGGFRYYRLGPPAFDASGRIDPEIGFDALAAHVWFAETGQPAARTDDARSPVLGVHKGTAYALLYNGVLGDRRPAGGNVLTAPVMAHLREMLPDHDGPWTIYGEACRMSAAKLAAAGVTFKQTPYDVKAR